MIKGVLLSVVIFKNNNFIFIFLFLFIIYMYGGSFIDAQREFFSLSEGVELMGQKENF